MRGTTGNILNPDNITNVSSGCDEYTRINQSISLTIAAKT